MPVLSTDRTELTFPPVLPAAGAARRGEMPPARSFKKSGVAVPAGRSETVQVKYCREEEDVVNQSCRSSLF